ncbi:hypothetical protein A5819_003827 [Enterococcus sp. 7E2_DIV0204]|uniref:HsdM family class I SAM-dependent methyltransferase n=1 Tax=Enterococcus sp. 7E2_DIV0204 TaxID=1834188 RepID=UPI000A3567C7|nr:N-6 DNA methylase [Enterococcus sp. 7E2_DIV0204]OTN83658.1 hypothetical protein A5819_003827 [Enterococcus sp. 7E2_DIV0204]
MNDWKLEKYVDDYVKAKFTTMGLVSQKDYYEQSDMSDYLKEALKGGAKTKNKANFGQPEFTFVFEINNRKIAVVIEDKLGLKKLISETKDGIKIDEKSVRSFAVNGAINYANVMIDNGKFDDVIAIGIAGDNEENIQYKVYYVYGSGEKSYKYLENVTTLDFLENKASFKEFYNQATLTEEEKHDILIRSKSDLAKQAKKLNKLMHNHNITAPQRVLYVSGMLLSMQDVLDPNGNKIQDGLLPEDLRGIQSETKRDGVQIYNQISEFLHARNIPNEKINLMLASFNEIKKDSQRDEETMLDKEVSKLFAQEQSANKQIFTFIYEFIFKSIDETAGHLDIMGEMYSEFLKYALGDGKEIGIVLTPPYVTKMMAKILKVNKNSKVMDLATGSAGFLISAMELMINDAETVGKETTAAKKQIKKIKKEQLLGIELNAEMYTLAATNMILRKDGSANIQKANTFKTPAELYEQFKPTILLLNPPFSFEENGMPFIVFGLEKMEIGGLGAIIIQDSAGSGKAVKSNQRILKKNQLIASIKMPVDLFQPMAGVQTSIYIFEHTGKEHDYDELVKFIDFRNDGYKRTARNLLEIDHPAERYEDILKIYKQGKRAQGLKAQWDLDSIYFEDTITDSGTDWNFERHQTIDTKPTEADFMKVVGDYLSWEVSQIIQGENFPK